MGIGGNSFRAASRGYGTLWALMLLGCRAAGPRHEVHPTPELVGSLTPSPVEGHRFGRWLEVHSEPEAEPFLEEACLREQVGDAEGAIEVLGDALKSKRGCAGLYEARGALYLSSGYPRAAVGDFQRAVALQPERSHAWFALGHAYEILGLSRQALESLEHARDLGGDDFGLCLSLARVYRTLGRTGLAARWYQRALVAYDGPMPESRNGELQVEIAVMATENAQRAALVQALRERLEAYEGRALSDDAWLLRALLRELAGEPPDTISATLRSVEVAPSELASLTRLQVMALQLADPETRPHVQGELLASESDPQRRATLERSLARP